MKNNDSCFFEMTAINVLDFYEKFAFSCRTPVTLNNISHFISSTKHLARKIAYLKCKFRTMNTLVVTN